MLPFNALLQSSHILDGIEAVKDEGGCYNDIPRNRFYSTSDFFVA
jgi:hypothetical protein